MQEFSQDGSELTRLGGPGTGAGRFYNPISVATGPSGRIYVVDYHNHRVQAFALADADSDGISDGTEGTVDTDGDGTPNRNDTDSDNDTIPDSTETTVDTDTDGKPNYVDTDSDNDGLPDAWEQAHGLNPLSGVGNDGADGDPDGDGISNGQEMRYGTDPQAETALPIGTAALLLLTLVLAGTGGIAARSMKRA